MTASFSPDKISRWTGLLCQLIQFDSTFEREHEVTEFVAAELLRMGVAFQEVPFDPVVLAALPGAQPPFSDVGGRRNLVAQVPGRKGGRSLVLNCHLDVVPAGPVAAWSHPPFSGHVDTARNVVCGRGAMDDKAGVAIALAVLEELAAGPPPDGDVIVQFVLEDESIGNGSLLCLNRGHGGDAAIILDGTRLDRGIGRHAGNLRFAVEMTGRPVSVSVSHMGRNAIEGLTSVLAAMKAHVLARNSALVAPWSLFPSPNQFVIQSVHGDGAVMTVPDFARGECHVTFTPPQSLAGMRAELEAVARRAATEAGDLAPRIVWDGFFATEPVASDDGELASVINGAATARGLPAIIFGPSTGTSDLRHFADRGIPCVLFGPGRGFNPHRADEFYHLDDLPQMVGLLLDVIGRWGRG